MAKRLLRHKGKPAAIYQDKPPAVPDHASRKDGASAGRRGVTTSVSGDETLHRMSTDVARTLNLFVIVVGEIVRRAQLELAHHRLEHRALRGVEV
jgi:hypothetical protein